MAAWLQHRLLPVQADAPVLEERTIHALLRDVLLLVTLTNERRLLKSRFLSQEY